MHRFIWDLRYPPWLTQAPDALNHEYPISAIFRDTPRHPLGAWALPGQYTMKLTVAGKTYEAPLTVRMDPRIQTPPADLAKQFEMETGAVAGLNQTYAAVQQVQSLRSELLAALAPEHPVSSPSP